MGLLPVPRNAILTGHDNKTLWHNAESFVKVNFELWSRRFILGFDAYSLKINVDNMSSVGKSMSVRNKGPE